MPITLVLADDHPIVLDGLEQLFGLEPDFRVLARCGDGEQAVRAVRRHRPDVLILDLRLPAKDGLVVLRELRADGPPTRVVLVTAALDENEVLEAMQLGVRGVILKEMAPRLLIQCVRKVHAGGEWLEKRSVGRAMQKVMRHDAGVRDLARVLTPREIELVRMVVLGLRNKEIAATLDIADGTVKVHLHNIYEKLGVDGRLELALYARHRGIV